MDGFDNFKIKFVYLLYDNLFYPKKKFMIMGLLNYAILLVIYIV